MVVAVDRATVVNTSFVLIPMKLDYLSMNGSMSLSSPVRMHGGLKCISFCLRLEQNYCTKIQISESFFFTYGHGIWSGHRHG